MDRLIAAFLWVGLISVALAQNAEVITRAAPLIGVNGQTVGLVVVRGSANATLARITVAPGGLTPGWHGVQFYTVGDCSDVGQFRRAKGIIDHLARNHGLLNAEGPKEGDLPNIYANPDGSANAEVSSHTVRLFGPSGLLEGDGSALIIRAAEDDQITQLSGSDNARIACAVLK